ncbi:MULTISPECIES: alpha/beta hydrolase [unclassified Methylobacterium]|jgi:acetyl esterase|uniref:alpha/beta hydrolase n=1 Tax=unclassified Methylobacterium TaxID=2615210 RepID=UPI001353A4DC|nr:alpha/beta hydrolase [Methylobacterium sp. 2A]MWV25987.1 alpha/beta hydrolase [Methylobacterium sp. 2A]
MALDPDIAAFLARDTGAAPDSLAELRAQTEASLVALQAAPEAVARVRDFRPGDTAMASPVPIRAYWPVDGDEAMAAIVFAHGGGWCLGSLAAYDAPCRALTNATGCVVFAIDYRLAPEHPFPAPLDDVYAALCWVAEHAAELAIDPNRIVVAGDSAGGNLAAATTLVARDRRAPRIAHQILIYPALNIDFGTPSYQQFMEGYYLTLDIMRLCWTTYLGSLDDGAPDYAVPGRAATHQLPPATILVCEFDPLRSEGSDYARKLERSGVATRLILLEGMVHACIHMTGLTAAAKQIFTLISTELRKSPQLSLDAASH